MKFEGRGLNPTGKNSLDSTLAAGSRKEFGGSVAARRLRRRRAGSRESKRARGSPWLRFSPRRSWSAKGFRISGSDLLDLDSLRAFRSTLDFETHLFPLAQ